MRPLRLFKNFRKMHLKGIKITIIVREPLKEIERPTFGGSRLIKKLKNELEKKEASCSIISLYDIPSISSYFLKIRKRKRIYKRSFLGRSERLRWLLSLLLALIGDILARFDIFFILKLARKLKKTQPDAVIYGPFGAFPLHLISKKLRIFLIIYEHNVDYYFFQEKLNSKVMKPLVCLLKYVELSALKKADLVICFNDKDKQRLCQDGIPSDKILVWKFEIEQRVCKKGTSRLPTNIKNEVKGKPVVCFLGSDYSVNVLGVKHLIEIAKDLTNIIFLIVGSVGEKFKYSKNLPPNVIITGYVRDVEPYLMAADIFVNPKITSDTGVEVKMFDYLKYGKPIVSTKIGARGFEHYKNVIIVKNLEEMKEKIKELCEKVEK